MGATLAKLRRAQCSHNVEERATFIPESEEANRDKSSS